MIGGIRFRERDSAIAANVFFFFVFFILRNGDKFVLSFFGLGPVMLCYAILCYAI